jgi:cysteinyl-tRNA synthetase
MLRLTNTVTQKKEQFKPLVDKNVLMYVCGVTPYDRAHIGHGRSYVSFDVLMRFLEFLGYNVTSCRNFTDIDDKLLKRAQERFGDQYRYHELAEFYIHDFHEAMKALGCLTPTNEPRVTKNIDAIIAFVQKLIDAGKAYVAEGDVYFKIDSFPEYGKLSKQKIEELRAGERVEVRTIKHDPLDFALWKSEPDGTFWKSPWGWGRPGWHIECSALAQKYLGDHIDIHGGGADLMFPHHENEIAQSESLLGSPFSQIWLHNALVRVNKEKMSKSLGNVWTLDDIFKTFDPMVIRYYFVTHHYRIPLDFSIEELQSAQKSYQKLIRAFEGVASHTYTIKELLADPITKQMIDFLSDDLNTAGLFGVVFENLDECKKNTELAQKIKFVLHTILGLALKPLAVNEVEITPEIKKLIDERETARAEKNWKRADELRDMLEKMGVNVQDSKLKS